MLDRANLTAAEQITLPLYPTAYGVVGLLFLLQGADRTSGPAFDPAKLLLPIHVWGLVFMAVALFEVLALSFWHRRRLYIWALRVGTGLATFWAVLLSAAALDSTSVSFTSVVWVLVTAVAQAASARMLASREMVA